MALILWDVAGRRASGLRSGCSRRGCCLRALPYNMVDFYPYPGTDAFGIYNRHGAHLIYLVAATVLFVRRPVMQTIVLSVLLLSLAFCKITAFLAAGPILFLASCWAHPAVDRHFHGARSACAVTGVAELTTGHVVPLRR
jgi:hypothetical protein